MKVTSLQSMQPQAGARRLPLLHAGVLGAMLVAGVLVAQVAQAQISNPPITGQMGVADTTSQRDVVPAQSGNTVAQAPAQGQAAGASQGGGQPAQAYQPPPGTMRTSPAPRIGRHADDGLLGDETIALFEVQASNIAAGPGQPMLGAAASRAYERYLKSFTATIPTFYGTKVSSGTSGGGSSGGQ